MKNKYILLILTFSFQLNLFSQENENLKLAKENIVKCKDDSCKANNYYIAANQYVKLNLNISNTYLDSLIKLSKDNKFDHILALGYVLKASNLRKLKDFKNAENLLLESKKLYNKNELIWKKQLGKKYKSECWVILNSIGTIYLQKNNLLKAKEYIHESISIIDKIGYEKEMGISLNNLGVIEKRNGNFVNAIEYYNKSIKYAKLDQNYTDIDLIETQSNIANIYKNLGDYEKAIQLHFKNKKLIESKLGENKHKIDIYINISQIYYLKGEYKIALDYLNKAEKINVEFNSIAEKIDIENKKGNVYIKQFQYEKASKSLFNALDVCELKNLQIERANIFGSISALYYEKKDFTKAIKFIDSAINIKEAKMSKDIAFEYSKKATILYKLKKEKKADFFFNKAIESAKNTNKQDKFSGYYASAGETFVELDNNKAKKYLEKGLKYALQFKQKRQEAAVYHNLARVFLSNKNYSMADSFINLAIKINKHNQFVSELGANYKVKADIQEKLGNKKSEYDYLIESMKITDSLNKLKESQYLVEAETKYQTKEKEKALAAKTKEAEMANIKNKQFLNIAKFSGIGILFLGIIAFFIFNYQKQKRKLASKEIESLKQENEIRELHGVLAGQEIERARIAQELHDGMGGLLAGSKLLIAKAIEEMPEIKASKAFQMGVENLNTASIELKQIALNLLPQVLSKMGLQNAIQDYCDNINQSGKVNIDYLNTNFKAKLHQDTELIIYRIVQELINNVLKHAHAKNVLFEMSERNKQLLISFSDDGIGFDIETLKTSKGLGFNSINNRLKLINGDIKIESKAGEGVQIEIKIPI